MSGPADVAVGGAVPKLQVRGDRWGVLSGLVGVSAVAWILLVLDARRMTYGASMNAMQSMAGSTMATMSAMHPWSASSLTSLAGMWGVMMVAMMLPTASSMTLMYAAVARKAARSQSPIAPTYVFVAGYAAVWLAFALVATAAQSGLADLALLSPSMQVAGPWLGGVLLVVAGLYQLTPYKRACLEQCRAPAHFIAQHWRKGGVGALRMGIEYGAFCLGCCWILMALLFVGGVMSFVWIVTLAAFILLEKTLPGAIIGGRAIGVAMIITGALSLSGVIQIG